MSGQEGTSSQSIFTVQPWSAILCQLSGGPPNYLTHGVTRCFGSAPCFPHGYNTHGAVEVAGAMWHWSRTARLLGGEAPIG